MSLFVKKLVDKVSLKKPGSFPDSLKPDDVNTRLVFHYGIPSGSISLAYNTVQHILAIATKDGQIKLFGADGSQALLKSSEPSPSKFLQFIENKGVLISISTNNVIEVWDLDKKCVSVVHHHEMEITSFSAMHIAPYFYVGDATGFISVLKIDTDQSRIEHMRYHIPFVASHGMPHEVGTDVDVKCILPHPMVESKRVLIIYSDGVLTLWGIHESRAISTNSNGTNTILQSVQETKRVTAACWSCPYGTKVAVGYNNGDIYIWGVEDSATNEASCGAINVIHKLNLGFKSERIPILKLKWVVDSGQKSSRLYALGFSDHHSANLLQVVLLNEYTESRTIKLGLQPPEPMLDMEFTTVATEQKKYKHEYLLMLGKSNHLYFYEDSSIERYLIQCQNKSTPSLPKEVMIKLPYGDSSITVMKYFSSLSCMASSSGDELGGRLPFFPFEKGAKSGNSNSFSSFSKARNLLVTGHFSGMINFWDASSPLMLPIASITQQNDNDSSPSGIPVTALHFSYESRVLLSGDQNGMVRVYTLKPEAFAPQNTFLSLQGSSKKGNHIIHRTKVVKVNGAVLSLCPTEDQKHIAVGSDQGHVTLIDQESLNILYQRQIVSEFSTGIISMHFNTCSFHGFEKNVLVVSSRDSSVSTLEKESGNPLSPNTVRPKKPSKALFTQILDSQGTPSADISNTDSENSAPKQSVMLLCSEKAAYVYSLSHLIQGTKKVLHKKKFSASSCIWASTFGSPDTGLALLFASGKIEIRSLPELSLVKECSLRGLAASITRPSSVRVSSSHDGEIVIANGDHELLFLSTLHNKEVYRHLDSVSQIVNKQLPVAEGNSPSFKQKKKGFFGSMVQENKDAKAKNDLEPEDSRRSIKELAILFSTSNFLPENTKEAEAGLEIEDIDIDGIEIDEEPKEKPIRGHAMVAGLNTKKIANKFNAIKGKLRYSNAKNEKVQQTNDEPVEEKSGAVDQIKKKYGYASSGEATSGVAMTAKNKLGENLRKLQGLGLKTSEMQDTARSFSSMAKEVLRFAESNDKK